VADGAYPLNMANGEVYTNALNAGQTRVYGSGGCGHGVGDD